MNALRARVDALRRKMARELTVVRLRRLSDEFSLQCAVAVGDRQPQPEPHAFIRRVVDAGFRLPTFMAATSTWTAAAARTPSPKSTAFSAPSSLGPPPAATSAPSSSQAGRACKLTPSALPGPWSACAPV